MLSWRERKKKLEYVQCAVGESTWECENLSWVLGCCDGDGDGDVVGDGFGEGERKREREKEGEREKEREERTQLTYPSHLYLLPCSSHNPIS